MVIQNEFRTTLTRAFLPKREEFLSYNWLKARWIFWTIRSDQFNLIGLTLEEILVLTNFNQIEDVSILEAIEDTKDSLYVLLMFNRKKIEEG